MNIYVASSWRNIVQPVIVKALRNMGHAVYDFRNPAPGNQGFSWREVDHNWANWTTQEYREGLKHPIAERGYKYDIEALEWADCCLLVLPSGRSASWELGYAMGQGKAAAVVSFGKCEPELMYSKATIIGSMKELFDNFGGGFSSEELRIRGENLFRSDMQYEVSRQAPDLSIETLGRHFDSVNGQDILGPLGAALDRHLER